MANNKYITLRNGGGGSQYELPAATSDTLGGVKIGSGVTVSSDGTITVPAPDLSNYYTSAQTENAITSKGYITGYTLSAATASALGGVKIGEGITVAADGTISVAGGGTEDIELPIAAAINELKTYYDVKLGQQYYKKSDVDALLSLFAAKGDLAAYTPTTTLNAELQAIYASIEDKELAISAALNDLNTRKQDNA